MTEVILAEGNAQLGSNENVIDEERSSIVLVVAWRLPLYNCVTTLDPNEMSTCTPVYPREGVFGTAEDQREAPPQLLMVWPVMYSPSSETRKATSFATSSGC